LKSNRPLEIPEIIIISSGFFLNFFWEVIHTSFYTLKESPFKILLSAWLHCAWVDVIITTGAFWLVSLLCRSRRWFLRLSQVNFLGFILIGLIYTFISEWANVHIFNTWVYNESMPMIPWARVGLTPILQWVIVPSIVILLARNYTLLIEANKKG
jgi:hypothetical protein